MSFLPRVDDARDLIKRAAGDVELVVVEDRVNWKSVRSVKK